MLSDNRLFILESLANLLRFETTFFFFFKLNNRLIKKKKVFSLGYKFYRTINMGYLAVWQFNYFVSGTMVL